ncbi:hypothetical protein ACQ4PT_007066 [Festuca glaucescens]
MESTTSPPPPGSGITATLARTTRPWANLSPDLLLDISSRLDEEAADFTRFHAVCTPWRDVLSRATIRPAFSPWLLALCSGRITRSTVDFGCVSSFEEAGRGRGRGNVLLPEPPDTCSTDGGDMNWVASADGTAAWLLIASPEPRLLHLLTGAITPLIAFPEDDEIKVPMENARGIVYGDGTVFLYRFSYEESTPKFTAAILRPAATSWTVMKKILEVPTGPRSDSRAAYHDGKVIVCVGDFWSVLTRGDFGGLAGLQSRWNKQRNYSDECHYVLESRGELLWASVRLEPDWYDAGVDLTSALSVTVHELERGAGGAMRWAVRDGWSLADRILFLGSPASFAVDAHKLGMRGGRAYFVFGSCVYRYGLVVGENELVRQLPLKWGTGGEGRVWISWRQPTIAPIQEIREGLRLYPNKKQKLCN